MPSDRIASLRGEDFRVESYETWFEHNPRGLCRIDLILLELFVGDTPAPIRRYYQLRTWLGEHWGALNTAAEARGVPLADYTDPRCW